MASHPHPPASAALTTPPRRFALNDAQAVYRLASEDTALGRRVKEAVDITEKALNDYGLEHVALSFNGGKDCTVLIHILAACILKHLHPSAFPSSSTSAPSSSSSAAAPPTLPLIPTIYIRTPSPFPQVEAFVSLCVGWYSLELEAVEGNMKESLQVYLDHQKARKGGGREVKAVLVGTRRGDPHGATLTPFAPTDASWPSFMRVHPILDWSYGDVWAFLRCGGLSLGAGGAAGEKGLAEGGRTGLEWCELYDYGYTSLGSTHNTFPNPLLRATTTDGHFHSSSSPATVSISAPAGGEPAPLGGWRPAWELEDESAERAGRETNLQAVVARTPHSPSSPSTTAPPLPPLPSVNVVDGAADATPIGSGTEGA
ncbi:hypothetical protein JCM6882_001690 [Rhodosporidiobolus microsporus]